MNLTRPCEPLRQKATPAITVRCLAGYYPPTGFMEMAKGTDKVRRYDLVVNKRDRGVVRRAAVRMQH